jgi:hypothetical protein
MKAIFSFVLITIGVSAQTWTPIAAKKTVTDVVWDSNGQKSLERVTEIRMRRALDGSWLEEAVERELVGGVQRSYRRVMSATERSSAILNDEARSMRVSRHSWTPVRLPVGEAGRRNPSRVDGQICFIQPVSGDHAKGETCVSQELDLQLRLQVESNLPRGRRAVYSFDVTAVQPDAQPAATFLLPAGYSRERCKNCAD